MRQTRLIIVKRGATELFEMLQRKFGKDPSVQIVWDSRVSDRRSKPESVPVNRRRRDRRLPINPAILNERGFLVTYRLQPPGRTSRGSGRSSA